MLDTLKTASEETIHSQQAAASAVRDHASALKRALDVGEEVGVRLN